MKNKNWVAFISIALSVLALVAFISFLQDRRVKRMDAYARANNCTWVYNGTMYGDNRDYTCKLNNN